MSTPAIEVFLKKEVSTPNVSSQRNIYREQSVGIDTKYREQMSVAKEMFLENKVSTPKDRD